MFLLAGCARDLEENVESVGSQAEGVTCLTVNLPSEGKTYMDADKDANNDHKVYWSNGDQVAVNGVESVALTNVPDCAGSVVFSFNGILNTPYNVLYPASVYTDESHITLPAVQTYKEGGFADNMFPMAGYSSDGMSISLRHLCAILKIQIKRAAADPDTDDIAGIRFRGHDGEQLCGDFAIDYANARLSGASEASKDTEISVSQSLPTSTDEAAVYYLVVPAVDYANGYEVTVVDVNGHYMVKSKTTAKSLEAGHLYAMAAFEFEPSGTELEIVIDSAQELVNFASAYNNKEYSAYDKLTVTLGGDINFNSTTSAAFNATGGISGFSGLFDGAGHSISGLEATAPLFATTATGSLVRDLTVEDDCSFAFTHSNTAQGRYGAIVGVHAGTLENIDVKADVSLAEVTGVTYLTALGGLVGRETAGAVKNCSYSGTVSAPAGFTSSGRILLGGIVAYVSATSSISGCTFEGAISNAAQSSYVKSSTTTTIIGGIVGYNDKANITSCTSTDAHDKVAGTSGTGHIVHKSAISNYSVIGGIVGENVNGTVSGCTNDASVLVTMVRASDSDETNTQARYIKTGGIAGNNNASGIISGCTNNGTVTHYSNTRIQSAGGIVGYNMGAVSNCTNTASITFGTTGVDPIYGARIPYMGGIIGENTSASVSDVHNQGSVVLSRTEMGSNGFRVCLGGVAGWNSAVLDGGFGKNITNTGLVHFNTNINQISSEGYRLGGIVGYSEASVKNARNSGYVHFQWAHASRAVQNAFLGGIVGLMAGNGEISGCNNEGGDSNAGEVSFDVTATSTASHTANYIGGILGYTENNVTVSSCSNSGYVHGGNSTKIDNTSCFAGGIVAYLAGVSSISACSNSGNVNNNQFTNTVTSTVAAFSGGIAGYVKALPASRIPISGCTVTSASLNHRRGYSGGIVGYAENVDMTNCSSSADASASTSWHIGGIAGWMVGSSASDCEMTGTTISSGQMRTAGGIVAKLDSGSSLADCTSAVTTISAVLTTTSASGFVQAGAIAGSSVSGSYISNCTYPGSGTIVYGNKNGTTNCDWQICGDSNFTAGTPPVVSKTKVSIIGDSISTYEGYLVSGYRKYYPTTSVPSITSVTQTYWYQFIYDYMPNAELCKNLSWSGSLVHRITDETYSSTHWYTKYFYARAAADGFGDPDVLIVNGGTNDYRYQGGTIATESDHSLAPGYKITGTSVPTDGEFATWFAAGDAATTTSQVAALADDSYIQAYIKLLQLAKVTCSSDLKLILCVGDALNATCQTTIQKIAAHYGAAVVDFLELSKTTPISKGSGVHPDAAGMATMAEYMWAQTEDFLSE
ncbi:MAG: hypothetical protein J5764_03585 [Bacteroidales bacterium]|nr:hypothetical protein [Bacteroidales bacterium]